MADDKPETVNDGSGGEDVILADEVKIKTKAAAMEAALSAPSPVRELLETLIAKASWGKK